MKYEYINSDLELEKLCHILENKEEIAVDIECENGLHHYGTFISIIQISTIEKNYIIDMLNINNVEPLKEVFENALIKKIFHDVNFDLSILYTQYKINVNNVYDTQMAVKILGDTEIGLGAVLKNYMGIEVEKKFQTADWTKRPLSKELLDYAVNDTAHMIKLKKILNEKLEKLERKKWVEEMFREIDFKVFEHKKPNPLEMRGAKQLEDYEKGILRRIYFLREELAKKVNKPVFYIMRNKRLIEIAKNPPKNVTEWKEMRGVHPIVKKYAWEFCNEVNQGKKERFVSIKKTKKKVSSPTPNRTEKTEKIIEIRNKIAEKHKIPPHLIMTKEQIDDLVTSKTFPNLYNWQRKLLEKDEKKIFSIINN
jgi:ribonuclease D